MQDFFSEKIKFFLGGSFAGFITSLNFLFIDQNIYIAFGLKLIGTVIITLVSGLATIAARDFYKWMSRGVVRVRKKSKQKNDDNQSQKNNNGKQANV